MTKKTDPPDTLPPLQLNHLLSGDFVMDLHGFWYTRMDRLNPREASPKYAGLEEEVKHLYDRIKVALPNEAAEKLNELCDTYTEMAAMITELYYRQGFSDGVMVIMQAIMASG